jgi:hypothetical protein
MTKREAEMVEQIIRRMNERQYWKLIGWLSQACKGSLWEWVRPYRKAGQDGS